MTPHHRFLLAQHLPMIDSVQDTIRQFEAQIDTVVWPFRGAVELLRTIPVVSTTAAHVIVAEIGCDMSRFPTARHLVSWAGLRPGMNESAGKRRSTHLRKGAPWLKPVLVQCGWAAGRTKGTYLQALFLRLKSRRGPRKAIVAVAASILTAAYYVLRDGVSYHELGPYHFLKRDRVRLAGTLARRPTRSRFVRSLATG